MAKFRFRYAPSPTGHLHIGGARTALFNYLLAKHYGGDFIVRFEDTDQQRNVPDGIETILADLHWLKLIPDETINHHEVYGPYLQSKRLNFYHQYATQLITNRHAYYCWCPVQDYKSSQSCPCFNLDNLTVTKLKQAGTAYGIRIKSNHQMKFIFQDLIRGEVVFLGKDIEDFIIIKQDQMPTYHFAVVVDDHLMNITHVIRGEEHLTNTSKQLLLYDYLGWTPPIFGHVALIIDEHHQKLSKRNPNVKQFIHQYIADGYLPEAMINFLSLLGWHPKTTQEFFSLTELINIYNFAGLSKAPGMFDVVKLTWINKKYLSEFTEAQYLKFCLPFIKAVYKQPLDDKWLHNVVMLFKSELTHGQEIILLTKLFFKDNYQLTKSLITHEDINWSIVKLIVNSLIPLFNNNIAFNIDDFQVFHQIIDQPDFASFNPSILKKHLFLTLRMCFTGQDFGPPLQTTVSLILESYTQLKLLQDIEFNFKWLLSL